MTKIWNATQKSWLKAYAPMFTEGEMATIFGRSQGSIRGACSRLGVVSARLNSKLDYTTENKIARLSLLGMCTHEVGDQQGQSKLTVVSVCKRFNVPVVSCHCEAAAVSTLNKPKSEHLTLRQAATLPKKVTTSSAPRVTKVRCIKNLIRDAKCGASTVYNALDTLGITYVKGIRTKKGVHRFTQDEYSRVVTYVKSQQGQRV